MDAPAKPTSESEAKRKMETEAFSLHMAAERGSLKNVREILEKGDVNVDAKDSRGLTPFALACRRRRRREIDKIGIMRALLAARADPRQEFIGHHDRTTTAAIAACELGNKEMLELLFEFGVSPNDKLRDSTLLLTAAVISGAKDVVKFLLDRGANVHMVDGWRGETALHMALRRRDTDMARMLLEAGADPNIRGCLEETALHVAFDVRDFDIAQSMVIARMLLKAGADPNIKDRSKETLLYKACGRSNYLDWVELLLKFKADANIKCTDKMKTALFAALLGDFRDKPALVRLLVSHGADIHLEMSRGQTLLNVAINSGSTQLTKLFLQLGARLNAPKGKPGPLHLACQRGHDQVAKVLLDAGAIVDACSANGETPLYRAMHSTCSKENALRTIKLLLARGTNVNWTNNSGWTPLHRTCFMIKPARVDRIRLILEKGADVNARTRFEGTPLSLLCRNPLNEGTVDRAAAAAAKLLLEYGADVEEAREDDGTLPFLNAVARKLPETMKQLFEFKMDRLPVGYDDDE